MLTNIEIDGLFASFEPVVQAPVARCFACRDIGFDVQQDEVRECWRARTGTPHNSPTPAGTIVRRAVLRLRDIGVIPDPHLFRVACRLAEFTSAEPCDTRRFVDHFFAHAKDPLRKFAEAVETLRRVWLLPVGSRRGRPAGYWIISESDDFAEWVNAAKQAPITQLTTIHRVARYNFPHFAEQLELEFWDDLGTEG